MKNLPIGMDLPGVEPPCQVIPELLVCMPERARCNFLLHPPEETAFHERLASRPLSYRVARAIPSRVFLMPTKTMFQLAPVQLPHSLFARNPLLLRAGVNVAVNDRIGHPSATGPAALLMENHIAEDVHAAEGYGLRDGPLHWCPRQE